MGSSFAHAASGMGSAVQAACDPGVELALLADLVPQGSFCVARNQGRDAPSATSLNAEIAAVFYSAATQYFL
jgi:hypothetical protein